MFLKVWSLERISEKLNKNVDTWCHTLLKQSLWGQSLRIPFLNNFPNVIIVCSKLWGLLRPPVHISQIYYLRFYNLYIISITFKTSFHWEPSDFYFVTNMHLSMIFTPLFKVLNSLSLMQTTLQDHAYVPCFTRNHEISSFWTDSTGLPAYNEHKLFFSYIFYNFSVMICT